MSFGSHLSTPAGAPAAPGSDFTATPGSASCGTGEVDDNHGQAFTDRRKAGGHRQMSERRQFGSSHADLSPAAKELAVAIDQYKLAFRRRYITCEEMLAIITQLGYQRAEQR